MARVGLLKRLENLWVLSTYTLPQDEIDRKHSIMQRLVNPKKRAAKIVDTTEVFEKLNNIDLE